MKGKGSCSPRVRCWMGVCGAWDRGSERASLDRAVLGCG